MTLQRAPALVFIFITLLIDIVGLGIILPVLPKLIQELTGSSMSDASRYGGWMMFAYAGMQFLFAPIIGGLSDRYGRRPILLLSLFGFGANYLLMSLSTHIVWLFAGRMLAGIAGASFTTATAYIADVSPPEKKAQNFGLIGMAFGIGFILGPVLGGIMGQFGTRWPFYAAAALGFLNTIFGYFFLPESLKPELRRPFNWRRANPIGSFKALAKNRSIRGLALALALVYIAIQSVQSTWSFYTLYRFGWTEAMVGYSLGVAGLLVAIVQGGLIRIVTPRLGSRTSAMIGLCCYATGLALFAFSNAGWMMFAFQTVYCMGGLTGPSMQGIMSNAIPANEQGELQGLLAGLVSLSAIIGPPMMTNLFSFFSGSDAPVYFPGAGFLTGSVLVCISIVIVGRAFQKHTREEGK